ncbi:hypothetical protein N0V93_001645 [Gnomoniopsis smithogilvyi]|uniref:Cytochrome P450 n=1 Tax=Gnomoniopsis smithogilvyi TaxID=1191159 RepID=A0A9W8Z4C5_9PEZI|nr:hypothetical protein N0V93_001645 [Gnomoniopsis smithogilvyi]
MALISEALDSSSFIAVVVVFAAIVTFSRWLYKCNMRTANFPPGPPTLPFLGNILQMPSKHPFLKYTEWSKQYGDIIGLKLGPLHIIVLNSPEVIQSLLVNRAPLYSGRPVPYLIRNFVYTDQDHILMFQNDAQLKRARTSLRSLTGPTGLKTALPMQDRIASKLITRLRETEYGASTCIGLWSFETAMTATMGPVGVEKAQHEILKVWTGVQHEILDTIESVVTLLYDIFPVIRYLPASPGKRSAKAAGKILWDFYSDCFCSLKRHMSQAEKFEDNCDYWGFIATILRSQEKSEDGNGDLVKEGKFDSHYKEASLISLAEAITDAATDTTTAVALSLILALAVNRDILRKAQVEIDQLCDQDQKLEPDYSDIGRLPYLKACLLETLRWRTPTPLLLPRRLEKDDVFRDYHLPKNSIILANVWAVLQDPKHYKSPDVFDPDRFMGEGTKGKPFSPFGVGRRMCPGDQFAMNSLMVVLSKLVRSFDFVLDGPTPDVSVEGGYGTGIVLTPKSLPVKFVPRKF